MLDVIEKYTFGDSNSFYYYLGILFVVLDENIASVHTAIVELPCTSLYPHSKLDFCCGSVFRHWVSRGHSMFLLYH